MDAERFTGLEDDIRNNNLSNRIWNAVIQMADVYKFKVKLKEVEAIIWRDIEITSVSSIVKFNNGG